MQKVQVYTTSPVGEYRGLKVFVKKQNMYYDRIRKLSDQLCERYGLSIIKEATQSRYEDYPAQHHQNSVRGAVDPHAVAARAMRIIGIAIGLRTAGSKRAKRTEKNDRLFFHHSNRRSVRIRGRAGTPGNRNRQTGQTSPRNTQYSIKKRIHWSDFGSFASAASSISPIPAMPSRSPYSRFHPPYPSPCHAP